MSAAALDALAGSRPGDWLTQRSESGSRLLHTLHEQCSAAGLTPQSVAQDDVATLHALFDVALEQGLGELLVDYVVEVCSDPFLTSADPVDAYLMDGRCMQQWAHRALRSSRARLLQALQQERLAAPGTATVLAAEAGRLHSLGLVLRALAQPEPTAAQPPSEEDGDLAEVQRLRQAVAAAAWAAAAARGGAQRWGAYASHAEWRGVANRRRDAAAPQGLFLADLLQALRDSGSEVPAYPFSSPEQAVELFATGSPGADAWRTKLALLVYACADAGYDIDADALRHAFDVGLADVIGWQAAFWLDDAARGTDAAENLERACRQLPGVAGPGTPFRVVEALAARGAPDVALAVQRCRGAPPADLPQAQALLDVRLSEGLLTDAVVEVQRFLDAAAGGASGDAAADALAQQLAEWAADNGQMQALSEMPLPAAVEHALLGWLTHSAMAGRVPGAQLPLFLLQRGALAAAAAASAALDQALSQGSLQEDEEVTRQRRAIAAAARQLLPAGASPAASFQLPRSRLDQAPAVRAEPGGDADMGVGADQAASASKSPAETCFSARLGRAAAGGPANDGTAQTPEIQPAGDSNGSLPASGRRGASARHMQEAEWGDAMGLAPRSGPRTRQAAKRQKTAAARH